MRTDVVLAGGLGILLGSVAQSWLSGRKRKKKKVLVSGCYDLLHSGHLTFFETAAHYGDVYVCVGKDENIIGLKGKAPLFAEDERLFFVQALQHVHHAEFEGALGYLGFEPNFERIRPDYFIVNEDSGGIDEKIALCKKWNCEFVCLPRDSKPGLPCRSSTAIKTMLAAGAAPEPKQVMVVLGWGEERVDGRPSRVDAAAVRLLQMALLYGTELHVVWLCSSSGSDDSFCDDEAAVILGAINSVARVSVLRCVDHQEPITTVEQHLASSASRPQVLVIPKNPLLGPLTSVCATHGIKLVLVTRPDPC